MGPKPTGAEDLAAAGRLTLVGVGRGAQNLAEGQLSTLGANVLFIVPGRNDTRRQGIESPKTLVLEDAEAITEQVPTEATSWLLTSATSSASISSARNLAQ